MCMLLGIRNIDEEVWTAGRPPRTHADAKQAQGTPTGARRPSCNASDELATLDKQLYVVIKDTLFCMDSWFDGLRPAVGEPD